MKLFVCCLFICATGIMSQAQSQDLPEVAAAKAAHFEAVRRAELVIANAPPVSHHPRPAVVETTQHKLGLNVNDTPEVAAAKAAHYEAVREAEYATSVANATGRAPDSKPIAATSASIAQAPAPVHYPAPAVHHYNSAPVVPTTQHQLGVSVHDTPEVAAAKAIHNEAVRRAQQTSGAVSNDHSYNHYSAPAVHHYQSAPVPETTQHQLGVNVHDTPEVAAAKAAHFEAVRRAETTSTASRFSDDGSYVMVPRYQASAPIVPVGPVVGGAVHIRDTPEVAAAKAAHFEALRRADMTAGPRFVDQYASMPHPVMYMAVPYHHGLNYNRMVPVVAVPQTNQHKLGVNVQDTPEVAAAKTAHFEAFRQAQLVAANEPEFPSNNYFSNPARQYGQVY